MLNTLILLGFSPVAINRMTFLEDTDVQILILIQILTILTLIQQIHLCILSRMQMVSPVFHTLVKFSVTCSLPTSNICH